jgi:molybdate transport system substrate-binding protein
MAVLTLGLAGCVSGNGPDGLGGSITVVASPALTDVMAGMAQAFNATYPGVRIDTVFAPESGLATAAAAPDILVAEDPDTLTALGVSGTPVAFAQGQLVLAVHQQELGKVRGLADLARPGLRLARCAADEPCGKNTDAVLAAAGVTVAATTVTEPDVRSVLRHLTDGSADAALVFRSDVNAAGGDIVAIELSMGTAAAATFAAALAKNAPNVRAARVFLNYLTSKPVQDVLISRGFGPPPPSS